MYCLDSLGITFRGTIDESQLQSIKTWVIDNSTVLSVMGAMLVVDKTCGVQIQSLDEQGCVVNSAGSAGSFPVGAQAGVAAGAGVLAVLVLVIFTTLVGISIKRKRAKLQ